MWLSDARVVLRDEVLPRASVHIEGGFIREIVEGPVPRGVDCTGLTLFPGFVDMHGDMIELELEPRARVDFPMSVALASLDARLAAAGVTTGYAAVSFSRGAQDGERRSYSHTSAVMRELHALRPTCRVDHRIHARFDITFENATGVLGQLIADGMVDLVSLMDHTPGQGQYRNLGIHIKNRAAQQGIREAEARAQVTQRIAEKQRPQEMLLSNMAEVSRLCAEHGISLASHDDDTVEKSHLMADLGAKIAEFPVTLEAAEATIARGMMTAMGAPNAMRGTSYSGNLSAREAHSAGLLNILASDYHPGAILAAIHALAPTDPDGMAGAVRLASTNPAKALGLTDRGEIALGKRADLFLTDANNRVMLTFLQGETIYSNGLLDVPAAVPASVARAS